MPRAKRLLVLAVCSGIAAVLQGIGLVRYLGRLPDDWVGIILYGVTAVAFAVIAVGFFIQWRKERRAEGWGDGG